jgi:hypothetical protein
MVGTLVMQIIGKSSHQVKVNNYVLQKFDFFAVDGTI